MTGITAANDLLPLVGSPAFLPAILSYVRNSSSGTLPLDPVIFQAILLCIIAGDKHLVLHTPEEDVGLVVRLTAWTLSSILGLPTNRLKIRPRPAPTSRSADINSPINPSLFLRSLFLQSTDNDASEHTRPPPHFRSRPGKSKRSNYSRSASFPNDHPSFADRESQASARHYPLTHSNTEPASIRSDTTQIEFPHALVISGLEHASTLEQRSLSRVMVEKQVILESTEGARQGNSIGGKTYHGLSEDSDYDGAWNIPEGFIAVYVCPWDIRDRPKIHRSLLDQFAMSSTVLVHQNVRQAFRILPFSTNTIPRTRHHSHSHSNPPTPSPLQALPLPQSRTPPILSRALPGGMHHHTNRNVQLIPSPIVPKQLLPPEFFRSLRKVSRNTHLSPALSLYLADLFSAARHHPQLDGTFLTARAMNDAEDLVRAIRVLGINLTGGELLRNNYGGLFNHEESEEDGGYRSFEEYDDIASGSMAIDLPRGPSPSSESVDYTSAQNIYVSEADVARIVPRVITHRLRVRNGPEDEVLRSAVFGAAFEHKHHRRDSDNESGYDWDIRRTIKDILIEILAEV